MLSFFFWLLVAMAFPWFAMKGLYWLDVISDPDEDDIDAY